MPDPIQRPLTASPPLAPGRTRSIARLAESRGRTLAQRSLTQRVFELIHAAGAGRFDRSGRGTRGSSRGREIENL